MGGLSICGACLTASEAVISVLAFAPPEGSRVKNREARLLNTVGCLRTPKKALNALLSGIALLWQSIVFRGLFLCTTTSGT